MKIILSAISFLLLINTAVAQDFEGKIFLISNTISDTLFYTYTVKGKYIKVDEFSKQKKLTKVLIINTENKSIIAINPARKVYTKLPAQFSSPLVESDEQGFDIIKTTTFKEINGYKCNLWRVRTKELNTDVSYWVAIDKFSFFDELIKTLHSNEKYLSFFLKIPSLEGAMPMACVERTLMRNEKKSMTVLEVRKNSIDDSVFIVPDDYKPYELNMLERY